MTLFSLSFTIMLAQSGLLHPLMLGLVAVVCLGVACFLIWRHSKSPAVHSEASFAQSRDTPPLTARMDNAASVASASASEEAEDVDFDDDSTDAVNVAEQIASMGRRPKAEEARAAEARGDYAAAADIWRKRADFANELRALVNTENHERLAELQLALGLSDQALEHLRALCQSSPSDEKVRLQLVQLYVDQGEFKEARALADVVAAPDAPITCTCEFLATVACAFESKGEFETALAYYELAAGKDPKQAEKLAPRMTYLRQITRLAKADAPSGAPEGLIDRVLDEDGTDFLKKLASGEVRKPDLDEQPVLVFKPHEVIVGHLALGGNSYEHEQSVRSFASAASRFEPGHIVGERPHSAVIEARDHLIDCPVAIRLTRISTEGDDYTILRERLRAISHLNHPNISKITYADRYGNIVRVVNEFHGGGNLKSLVARLNKVGFPLMLKVLLQISSGMDDAHRNGIIHGDLRAENVMLGHDNMIKIVDFALKPWPVRGESTPADAAAQNQEMQSDLVMFADIMEYLLDNSIIAPHVAQNLNGYDPTEDVRDLIRRAREGKFNSIHYIHRGIHSLLERVVPNSA